MDESGDLNFSNRGTQYYVFAITWTYHPARVARELTSLRFALLKAGNDLPSFHASEDKQAHRNQVVQILRNDDSWYFAAVVVEKPKVNPVLWDRQRFYPRFAIIPLRFVLRGGVPRKATRILVYTDRLPVTRHRRAVEKAIKEACVPEIPRRIPFHIYHHPRESNAWLQATDYCCWAVYRKWESRDPRTYNTIRPRLAAPELDALQSGTALFY